MKIPTRNPKPPTPCLAKRKADYQTVCSVRQLVDHREPKSHMVPVVDAAEKMAAESAGKWITCQTDKESFADWLKKHNIPTTP